MIYFLRNFSIKLWIAVIMVFPLTFFILPFAEKFLPDLSHWVLFLLLLSAMFIVTGFIMNFIGQRAILGHINEAKNWERDGITNKSASCYLKAIEIFDSCLLSVLSAKKTGLILTGAIAQFALATVTSNNDCFDNAIIAFLDRKPDEHEIARLWLKRIIKKSENKRFELKEERLITRLAEAKDISAQVLPLLAEIFKNQQRGDFAAQRVFSFIKEMDLDQGYFQEETSNGKSHDIPTDMECECFETRDNRAGSINYLEKRSDSDNKSNISGLTQSTEDVSSDSSSSSVEEYKDISYHSNTISEQRADFTDFRSNRSFTGRNYNRKYKKVSEHPSYIMTVIHVSGRIALSTILWILFLPLRILKLIFRLIRKLSTLAVDFYEDLHLNPARLTRFRKNLKRIIVLGSVAGIVILVINTVSHLSHTPAPPPPSLPAETQSENSEVSSAEPAKRFTIQVAAYLAQRHAEEYLKRLEAKGVEGARINSVEGGGKTWYLIRVGQFETKEDATQYGNRLKHDKMVDDFFVDNSGE